MLGCASALFSYKRDIMVPRNDSHSDSFAGEMRSLNISIPESSGDFLSMTFAELADAKQTIESNVDRLLLLLHETYKFDMDLPLVIDGFPRSDVDVVTVRLIRSKVIRLTNDHTTILGHLQHHLEQQLGKTTEPLLNNQHIEDSISTDAVRPDHDLEVFAVVRGVEPNSPAAKAGLLIGDRIVKFDDDIHAQNHVKLSAIAKRVREKVETGVSVEVLRNGSMKALQLIPTENWGGKGLLGCHIVPL